MIVNSKDKDDLDRELIEEINLKYESHNREVDSSAFPRIRRFFLGAVALLLALVFLFTVTGRWLSVFAGPSYSFLRESWALSGDPMIRELRKSVVQVYVESRSGGPQLRGSGFIIDPDGLIATNRHLVENASAVRVSLSGKGTFSAQEWLISPHVDLAVIRLSADNLPAVTISDSAALPGDELLVIGNPLQFARIANKGILAGYLENFNRQTPFLVVDALIYPGSSGSPLFNGQGEVVGIIFATLQRSDPAEVRGLAVDIAELRLFLEEVIYD